MVKYSKDAQAESRTRLLETYELTPGTTVYLNRRSQKRTEPGLVSIHTVKRGAILDITRDAARVLGLKFDADKGTVRLNEVMGFYTVYSLAHCLYPEGAPCVGAGCPSNDHTNDFGVFSREFYLEHSDEFEGKTSTEYCAARGKAYRATEPSRFASTRRHRDGGYSLRHAWI